MSAQHTPGPWLSVGDGARVVALRSSRLVATLESESQSERVANAALVQAAPTMKAALALAVRVLEKLPEKNQEQALAWLECRNALAMVRP